MNTTRTLNKFAALLALLLTASFISAQTYSVTLEFAPDCWGYETSWALTDSNGSVIQSVGSNVYTSAFPNGEGMQTYSLTLNEGECYTMTIEDTYGDGMNGSTYGSCDVDGTATFYVNGSQIAALSDPDFGSSTSFPVCVIEGCTDSGASNYNSSATISTATCTYPEAVAAFTYTIESSSCGESVISFTNNSTDATNYNWNFLYGTPASSNEENPSVSFPTGMETSVVLQAINSNSTSSANTSIDIPLNDEGSYVKLVVSPDCWGTELGWTLKDPDNNVVQSLSIGTYPDEFPSQSGTFEYEFCLSDGCYTFDWEDSYGDGFEAAIYGSCDEDATYHFEDELGNIIHSFDDTINWGYAYSDTPCVSETYVWKGYSDNDWNNTSNWVGNLVPESSSRVIIDTETHAPELSSTVSCHQLTINAGKNILFANNSGKINLTGDFINLGAFSSEKGMINFTGSNTQYIKGTATPEFYKLKINSNDSVRMLTEVNMLGPIMMTKGVLDFNNNEVTLLSNENTTGSIGEIKSAAEIVGDTINFQRYFPSGPGSWRMLCSPIKDATFEQWNDDFPTTGFTGSDYPTYPSAQNPWSNIRYYDETFTSGDEGDMNFGFQSVDNITDVIGNEKGYFVYFIPGPTLVDMRGEFHKYDQSSDLDHSVSGLDIYNDGWNLLANPYPSAIDWDDALGFDKVSLNNAIYAYDPHLGQYSSYVNGISIGALNSQIAPGQSFWVRTSAANPSITINEKAKTNSSGVFMRSSDANTETVIRVRLDGGNHYDETVVGFNDQATQEFDGNYDAYKFYAVDVTIPSIAAIPDTAVPERHAISMVPVPEEELIIPLEIKPGDQTDLMISNVNVDSFDDNICMILEDKELNSFTPFNEGDEYPFIMSDTSSINRFVLHVSAPLDVISFDESCPDTDNGSIIAQGFGEGPWNFVWKDEMETVIQETLGSTVPDQMDNLTPGFYMVEVSNNNPACNAATKVIQVQAAPEVTVEVYSERATCNQEETGSIELELGNTYDWNIEIQDDNYNEVHVADDANGTLVVNGLNPELYHIVAIASCGLEMGIEPIDLSDPAAVIADFSAEQTAYLVGESIFITNSSENATGQQWNFGDGFTDTVNENPVYQYEEAGTYTIELTATNGSCEDIKTMEITITEREDEIVDEGSGGNGSSPATVGITGLAEASDGKVEVQNDLLDVNFTGEQIMIAAKTTVAEQVKITVYSISGQIVIEEYRDAIDANVIQLNTSGLAPGVFYLNISTQDEVIHAEKFINS